MQKSVPMTMYKNCSVDGYNMVFEVKIQKILVSTVNGLNGNLVPRAMPVRGLGWHWLWGN
jgi:hypothetical protein